MTERRIAEGRYIVRSVYDPITGVTREERRPAYEDEL